MLKRFTAACLCLLILVPAAMANTFTVGSGGAYATVGAAVADVGTASNDVLDFISPVTEAGAITLSKAFTINLNGNNWTLAGAAAVNVGAATSINGPGAISGGTNNQFAVNAALNLSDLTINGSGANRCLNINAATVTATNVIVGGANQGGVALRASGAVAILSNCTIQNNVGTYTAGSGFGQIVLNAATPGGASITLNNTTVDRGASPAPAFVVGNLATSTNTVSMIGGHILGGSTASANGIIRDTAGTSEGGMAAFSFDGVKITNIGTGPAVVLDRGNFSAINGTVLGVSSVPDNSGHVFNLTGTPVVTLSNCDLSSNSGASYASVFPSAVFAGGGSFSATNTDFRIPGGGTRITNFTGGPMNFTGCTIAPLSGGAGGLTGNGNISLTNCSISSGGNSFGSNFASSPTIDIVNPTVIGNCGAIMFTNTASAVINLRGTSASAKLNLDPFVSAGTILFGRISAGGFGFYDCTLSNSGIYRLVDANSLTLTDNIALNFDRCIFTNGTGKVSSDDAGTPAFGITLTAINSVWAGFSDDIFRLSPFPATHTGPDNFNLTHCTLLGVSRPGGVSQMINAAGSPAGSVMNLNYCIVDAATAAYPAVFSSTGTGAQNVISPPTVDVAFPNNLTGTISGNPGVNAAGEPQVPASAIVYTAPSASTTTLDVLGNTRPSGGGDLAADPGAYEETSQVPVELSTFTLE